jgi:hypothetical protein
MPPIEITVDGVYGGLKLTREGKNSRRGGRLFRIVQA